MSSQVFKMKAVFGAPISPCGSVEAGGGPKILVVDATRRLVEATVGARALLAEGRLLKRCLGQIVAVARADGVRLRAALTGAVKDGHARVLLEGDADRLEIDLVALHAEDQTGLRVMMILKPALEERHQRIGEAQSRFGLTPAEGKLLAALFEGCSVPQAADRLGVRPTTARTHLQRVFDKTGVRRQGDLLRLVGCV